VTYADYRDGKPVVLTAALTGGVHGKEATPNLPETPEEIGEAAAAAEEAGASIVHLHARRDDGERAFATERF
jgi:3-keto-5-aminohexanoate cleavage enzyme